MELIMFLPIGLFVLITCFKLIDYHYDIKELKAWINNVDNRVYKCANTLEDELHLAYKIDNGWMQIPLKDVVQELLNVHGFEVKKRDSEYVLINKVGDK